MGDYIYTGHFNHQKFRSEFTSNLAKYGPFDANTLNNAEALLSSMENDTRMHDIRRMAYLMATAFWETKSKVKGKLIPVKDHGKPKLDKDHKPIMRQRKETDAISPGKEETGLGKGKNYERAVKVKAVGDSAQVTEQDGDQFKITAKGTIIKLTKKAKPGSSATGPVSDIYKNDDGDEHVYYGRGLTQLTGWGNYATQGIRLGVGFQFLFDPDAVGTLDNSYDIISDGMLYGHGFANGHKFANYFDDDHTDYESARNMVNSKDHKPDVPIIAKAIETALMNSRMPEAVAQTKQSVP